MSGTTKHCFRLDSKNWAPEPKPNSTAQGIVTTSTRQKGRTYYYYHYHYYYYYYYYHHYYYHYYSCCYYDFNHYIYIYCCHVFCTKVILSVLVPSSVHPLVIPCSLDEQQSSVVAPRFFVRPRTLKVSALGAVGNPI